MEDYPAGDYNWSVWEHDRAHEGDRFFLVRVGQGNTGVVMSGYFTSEPYEGEDWSGKGRQTFYMDMCPLYMFHPDKTKILTTKELRQAVPDFEWGGGHSGRLLTPSQAAALEARWEEFLQTVDEDVYDLEDDDSCVVIARRCEPATLEDCIRLATIALSGQKDLDNKPAILHSLRVGLRGQNSEEQMVGFLHDVVEDSNYTFSDLYCKGVDRRVVEALKLLTHNKTTDYFAYVQNILDSKNPLAIAVKHYDLEDNLARGRAGGHLKQVAKHEKALAMFRDYKAICSK